MTVNIDLVDLPDRRWAVSWVNPDGLKTFNRNFFWLFRDLDLVEFLTVECGVWEFTLGILTQGGRSDDYTITAAETAQRSQTHKLNEYLKNFFVITSVAVPKIEQAIRIKKGLDRQILMQALTNVYHD